MEQVHSNTRMVRSTGNSYDVMFVHRRLSSSETTKAINRQGATAEILHEKLYIYGCIYLYVDAREKLVRQVL